MTAPVKLMDAIPPSEMRTPPKVGPTIYALGLKTEDLGHWKTLVSPPCLKKGRNNMLALIYLTFVTGTSKRKKHSFGRLRCHVLNVQSNQLEMNSRLSYVIINIHKPYLPGTSINYWCTIQLLQPLILDDLGQLVARFNQQEPGNAVPVASPDAVVGNMGWRGKKNTVLLHLKFMKKNWRFQLDDFNCAFRLNVVETYGARSNLSTLHS